MSANVKVVPGTPLLVIDGVPTYVHGANYACRNYSEFGNAHWGASNRVVNHRAAIEADFDKLAAQGVTAVRWMLFANGNSGIAYDAGTRLPIGIDPAAFEDIDAALEIARGRGIRILFVALDFHAMDPVTHPEILLTSAGRQVFLEKVMQPVLARYANEDAIFAWEVMNEPDWILSDFSKPPRNAHKRPFQQIRFAEFATFTKEFADAVHRTTDALVTVGGAKPKHVAKWDAPELGLDFVQVHLYYKEGDHKRGDPDFFGTTAASHGLRRPLLIGEVPGKGDQHKPPVDLRKWLEFGFGAGYAGVWPWSFTGGDPVSPYDGAAMLEFALKHPTLANPRCYRGRETSPRESTE